MAQARPFVLSLATFAFVSAFVVASGCEDVPELRFVAEDSSLADAADASDDVDGRTPADSANEGATSSCPGKVPLGADGCCDTVPCVEKNCEQQCAQKNCSTCVSTGEYCCPVGAGRCITPGAACR